MRPNFEDPLDTAKQLVHQNITLYNGPGYEIWKQFLPKSSLPEYNILGENMIIADDWDHCDYMTEHYALGAGTHAQMRSALGWWELEIGENKKITSSSISALLYPSISIKS